MKHFTVMCQQKNGVGTIWTDAVMATDLEDAKVNGREACAKDWEWEEEDVHVLAVIEGEATFLHFDDSHLEQ